MSDSKKRGSKKSKSKSEKSNAGSTKTLSTLSEPAKTAGESAGKAYASVAECFGGEKEMNRTMKRYNPMLYQFVENSFLKRIPFTNKASKFVMFLIVIAVVQSGLDHLRLGFGSGHKVDRTKSLLTTTMLISALQLIPSFIFDTQYHFGALWQFFVPVVLSITPWKDAPEQTVATTICDTFFSVWAAALNTALPNMLSFESSTPVAVCAAALVTLLFWIGYLGAMAVYIIVWAFLSLATISTLGMEVINKKENPSAFYAQMTVWHNVLAIWLWRYLIAAMESTSIPGVISVLGIILHYCPTYFLWMTALFFGMLMTKKTEKRHVASTWYAQWLLQVYNSTHPKESSSSRKESSSSKGHSSSKDGK
ncbi:hypothetical protein IAT38_008291 [Cryptococcus sp. DSM 104549]